MPNPKAIQRQEEEMKKQINKYLEAGIINPCICDDLGHCLFHFVVIFESTDILTLLMSLDDDLSKYVNIVGKSPSDDAMKMGKWSHVQQIALAKMGQRMKNQAKTEEKRIESKRGIVSQFIKLRRRIVEEKSEKGKDEEYEKKKTVDEKKDPNESKEEKKNENENENESKKEKKECELNDPFLEELSNTVLKLIEMQAPISDDMLYLCWKYEGGKKKNEDNRLWIRLKKLIGDILDDSKNKQKWIWFKQNLLSSVIWYEFVKISQSDPLLQHSIDTINSGADDNVGDGGRQIIEMICECGCAYDLATPINVHKRHYFYCTMCKQYPRGYFYHCPQAEKAGRTGKEHPPTDICIQCADIKAKRDKRLQKESKKTNVKNNNKKQGTVSEGKEVILYNELFGMANERLNKQKIKLKKIIDAMSHKTSWKQMVRYSVYGVDKKLSENLRQDASEHLTFPNELKFDVKKLSTLGLKDFYDTKIYLPNLMIVASALNDRFHHVMKNDILKKGMHFL